MNRGDLRDFETETDAREREAEVARIGRMTKTELKALWRATYRSEPATAFGPDLLRRSLAYKVQSQALGEISQAVRRELAGLIKEFRKAPNSRMQLPRRVKSGTVLIREWKGKVNRVTVIEDRFLYEGHTYASLSEIACLITGTNWNGPRFFGLRPSENAKAAAKAASGVVAKQTRPAQRLRRTTDGADAFR